MHTPLFIYGYGFAKFKWLCSVSAASSAQVNACSGPFECRVVLREVRGQSWRQGRINTGAASRQPWIWCGINRPFPTFCFALAETEEACEQGESEECLSALSLSSTEYIRIYKVVRQWIPTPNGMLRDRETFLKIHWLSCVLLFHCIFVMHVTNDTVK